MEFAKSKEDLKTLIDDSYLQAKVDLGFYFQKDSGHSSYSDLNKLKEIEGKPVLLHLINKLMEDGATFGNDVFWSLVRISKDIVSEDQIIPAIASNAMKAKNFRGDIVKITGVILNGKDGL